VLAFIRLLPVDIWQAEVADEELGSEQLQVFIAWVFSPNSG